MAVPVPRDRVVDLFKKAAGRPLKAKDSVGVKGKGAMLVEADDNVLSGPIIIPPGPEGNAQAAKSGDVVEVLIVEHPTAVTTAVGRIVRSLGKRGRLDVEIERILAEK